MFSFKASPQTKVGGLLAFVRLKEARMGKARVVKMSEARRLLGRKSSRSVRSTEPSPGYDVHFGGRDRLAASGEHPAAKLPKTTLGDVVRMLEGPEWRGVLALDTFEQRIVFRCAPPFDETERRVGKTLGDVDIDRIRLWFEAERGLVVTRRNVEDAARIVASNHAYHAVEQQLTSLHWDGVSRVDTWLEDYCGVVPNSSEHARMIRAVARKWLLSCVARSMNPGCKVDTMLILEGRQGIGKSTALRTLAGVNTLRGTDLHCDSAIDIRGKEACQMLQGVWIYELAELDALLRRETSVVKAFLSRASDRYRVPYGRVPETVPRSVVFCGTTNQGTYFKDVSGNRRFWVVRCENSIDIEGLAIVRDQLWAETVHLYGQGEVWHLCSREDAVMREEQALRVEVDPWSALIGRWVNDRCRTGLEREARGANGTERGAREAAGSGLGTGRGAREAAGSGTGREAERHAGRFTMEELLHSALGIQAQSGNPRITSRVARILESLGFERRRTMTAGTRGYFYALRLPPCPPCLPSAASGKSALSSVRK